MVSIPRSHAIVLCPVRAPGGAVVGQVVIENGRRVFERRISAAAHERIRFRERDAWPAGQHLLADLRRWSVTLLRYVTREGVYEVDLAEFLGRALVLDFPHERQFVLPRRFWSFTPSLEHRCTPPVATAEQQPLLLA